MKELTFSVITLSYDNEKYTEKFVESIRLNSRLNYELIIVDNGSKKHVQDWVRKNSDKCIIFNENQGFAKGFNAGINIANGKYILMANNDTEFPKDWDINLVETFEKFPNIGMVSPTYTNGAGVVARREKPGKSQILLQKFGDYPSGVAYCCENKFLKETLIGWSEDYHLASGEDADLCYKIWSKNYDIVVDERILVIHEGKVTTKTKIKKWKKLWKKNARQFRRKWFFYYFFKPLARRYIEFKYDKK